MNRLVSYSETSSDEEEKHSVQLLTCGTSTEDATHRIGEHNSSVIPTSLHVADTGTYDTQNDEKVTTDLPITDESDIEFIEQTSSSCNLQGKLIEIDCKAQSFGDSYNLDANLLTNSDVYSYDFQSDNKLKGDSTHTHTVRHRDHQVIDIGRQNKEQKPQSADFKDSHGSQNLNKICGISHSDKQKQTHVEEDHISTAAGRAQFQPTSQRKRKLNNDRVEALHVPESIQCMYHKQQQKWVDNPAEHENRVRTFPHLEGNWATHVYIPVKKSTAFVEFVDELLRFLAPPTFHVVEEFHVSLSRTVTIRYHWIEPLVDSLRDNLKTLKSCFSELVAVKLFTNDEKTRTFVVLELSQDDGEFLDYVKSVDKSFAEFKLPLYYENPSFHISIGWCLGDATQMIADDKFSKAKEMFGEFLAANPDLSILYVQHICVLTGSKSFVITLQDQDK